MLRLTLQLTFSALPDVMRFEKDSVRLQAETWLARVMRFLLHSLSVLASASFSEVRLTAAHSSCIVVFKPGGIRIRTMPSRMVPLPVQVSERKTGNERE